jgi:5-methylcytosine-specific restriction endonuclease McrA
MPQYTQEQIEQRKAAGVKMNRLDCGWSIPPATLTEIIRRLDSWNPQTDTEKRDKHICELAFIQNMNASQIARLNDPLIVGMGNRSRGKPLSHRSISEICNRFAPEVRNIETKKSRSRAQRNSLFKERQKGVINKPRICAACGNKENTELHHIIPIAAGGTNDNFNLIYLCHDCHMNLHHAIYDKLGNSFSNNL